MLFIKNWKLISILFVFPILVNAKVYTFSNREKDSVLGFISRKVYQEINVELKKKGMEIVFEELPGTRDLIHVNKGIIDGDVGKPNIPKVFNRFPNIRLVEESIADLETIIVTKKANVEKVSLEDSRLTAGVIRGAYTSSLAAKNLQLTTVNSYKQLFSILEFDRVDMIIVYRINGIIIANTQEIEKRNFVIKETTLSPISVYPIYYKENKKLARELTKALKKLKREGRIDSVIKSANKEFYSTLKN